MIKNQIRRKLEVAIMVSIFFVVLLEKFTSITQPEQADKIFIAFAAGWVSLYIINYAIYFIVEKQIKYNMVSVWINYLLVINFFLIPFQMFYILFSLNGTNFGELSFLWSFGFASMVLIPLLLILLFLFGIRLQGDIKDGQ